MTIKDIKVGSTYFFEDKFITIDKIEVDDIHTILTYHYGENWSFLAFWPSEYNIDFFFEKSPFNFQLELSFL